MWNARAVSCNSIVSVSGRAGVGGDALKRENSANPLSTLGLGLPGLARWYPHTRRAPGMDVFTLLANPWLHPPGHVHRQDMDWKAGQCTVTIWDVRQTRYRLGSLFFFAWYVHICRAQGRWRRIYMDMDITFHSETWGLTTIGPHSCKDEKSARNTGKEWGGHTCTCTCTDGNLDSPGNALTRIRITHDKDILVVIGRRISIGLPWGCQFLVVGILHQLHSLHIIHSSGEC